MTTVDRSLMRGVMGLVHANGGNVKSRIRMQKLAYFLNRLGDADLSAAQFTYHHYGPYSREVSDALQDAVVFGLLDERVEHFGEGSVVYSYALTKEGKEWAEQTDAGHTFIHKHAMEVLKDAHWRALELGATVAYLQEREGVRDREEAFSRALELKPNCLRYLKQATEIVDKLERVGHVSQRNTLTDGVPGLSHIHPSDCASPHSDRPAGSAPGRR